MAQFDRITHDPRIMGGKPTIRGMRVTVGMIVGLIGAGRTIDRTAKEVDGVGMPSANGARRNNPEVEAGSVARPPASAGEIPARSGCVVCPFGVPSG